MTFDDLGLIEPILEAVRSRGFESPTPIQAEMIPYLLNHPNDVTGLAQTGTGKTAAFGLPILQNIKTAERCTQALILTPTRELGLQVSREIASYGRNISGLHTTTVYGGTAFGPQIRDLRSGVHVVTATPGRLKDLLDRGVADLSALRYLVLDEADQMLDMGFKEDLDAILKSANPQRQTLLFSATMPPDVAAIARKYMKDPHEIVSGERNIGSADITHQAYRIHAGDKYPALRRLIDYWPDMYALVFCRTRQTTQDVAVKLARDGYAADALHGDLSQVQRESVMRRFRLGNPAILVATDVAARGLDVDSLSHVIHYDLPDETAAYNHRSGRTGRAGRTGTSLSLVNIRETHRLKTIEKVLGRRIEDGRIPSGEEVCEKRLMNLVDRVNQVDVNDEVITRYLDRVRDKLDGQDRESLLRRFISVEFNRFLETYGNAPDLNPPPKRTRRDVTLAVGSKSNFQSNKVHGGMVRLRINLGKRQSILPPQIIGLINQATRSRDIHIGRIDIGAEWSDIQVEGAMAERVETALRGQDYRGVRVRTERGRDGRPPNKGKKNRSHANKRPRSR